MTFKYEQFEKALHLLNGRLAIADAPNYNFIVCGGTGLMATGLVQRTTRDVDIVAMSDDAGELIDPAPLPVPLLKAAHEVAEDLGFPENWLNNGPSSGEGGIFQLGLPQGFSDRLSWRRFGEKLKVAFVSRFDQIHFKLYAAVDRFGSYHASDLKELAPTDEELLTAAAWTRTHDPSEGYLESLRMFFRKFGYEHLAEQI